MKLIEWFDTLPKIYKEQAIREAFAQALDPNQQHSDIISALNDITWEETSQGDGYWEDLCNRIESGDMTPWPQEANWENARRHTVARAVDSNGDCFFYKVVDLDEGWDITTEECGTVQDMDGVDWRKTLQLNPRH